MPRNAGASATCADVTIRHVQFSKKTIRESMKKFPRNPTGWIRFSMNTFLSPFIILSNDLLFFFFIIIFMRDDNCLYLILKP